ncbi:hypothetical protein, partial [Clostridium haemolyticum]|uniref:hypothetical protein n=1 Tax=Clostridium haemolyticum TaxID=84025 RepID=UPI00195B22DD
SRITLALPRRILHPSSSYTLTISPLFNLGGNAVRLLSNSFSTLITSEFFLHLYIYSQYSFHLTFQMEL